MAGVPSKWTRENNHDWTIPLKQTATYIAMVTIWTYTLYQFEGESCAETIFYSKNTGVTWKPQQKNVSTKKPRNDNRKLRYCYSHQLCFNYVPGTLINHYSLRIRGQDISPMLIGEKHWTSWFKLLKSATITCANDLWKSPWHNLRETLSGSNKFLLSMTKTF